MINLLNVETAMSILLYVISAAVILHVALYLKDNY